MRKAVAIARTTAHEILSEPLSLLITLSSLTLAVLAPVLHYHQFGEATRMARDAMFSSLFLGSMLIAVFGTIKSMRRELESGTADMAFAHAVSRKVFFLAKTAGSLLSLVVFAAIVLSAGSLMVFGAALGEAVAYRTGDIAKVFGPCVAGGVFLLIAPVVIGAALNRFAHCRYVLSVHLLMLLFALLILAAAPFAYPRLLAYLPVALLVLSVPVVFAVVSAAAAVLLKANAAASVTGVFFLAFLPAVGNYYLADALSKGGTLPVGYTIAALLSALPFLIVFLFAGLRFINRPRF